MLVEIATYLEEQELGTRGTDLFEDQMPDGTDLCTALYETPGVPPNGAFGEESLFDETPGLTVVARGPNRDAARERILALYMELPKLQAVPLSGTLYRMVRPLDSPHRTKRDSKDAVYYTVTFHVEKEMSAV